MFIDTAVMSAMM